MDPLTGVGNRRSMEDRLARCVAERRRAGAAVGVLFIDIDHFKSINDIYGHEIGDRVLKMIAETLKHNLRFSDSLARWGGDEFLVLLRQVGPGPLPVARGQTAHAGGQLVPHPR